MKKNSFSMIDENGNETVYDVLFTFESEEWKVIETILETLQEQVRNAANNSGEQEQ